MSSPKFELDEFERTLLASARDERMDDDRKAALAAALGLGAGAVTTMAAIGTKAAKAGVAASKAKATFSLAVLKWIAAGAVGGAAIVSAAATARHVRDGDTVEITGRERAPSLGTPESAVRKPPIPADTASVVQAPPRNAEPAPPSAPNEPARPAAHAERAPASSTHEPAQAPAIAVAPSVADSASTATPPLVSPVPSALSPTAIASAPAPAPLLADEQRIIERARRALFDGDLASADRTLDEHDRLYPRGELAEESSMIRIEVLDRSGDHARAQREARAFLQRWPSSPYAGRLRALAAGTPRP